MENSNNSFEVDSNEVHSTDGDDVDDADNADEDDLAELDAVEGDDDVDDADNGDEDYSAELDAVVGNDDDVDDADNGDEDDSAELDAVVGDKRYGKCKGFSIRKSDIRSKWSEDSKIIVMRQFVCNKHGLREDKHFSRLDRKRDERRITRTKCLARICLHYNAKKGRYVVSFFEETHNHELTPYRFMHLHPVYRQIYEVDRAQIDGLQSHGIRTCHIVGYMVALKGGYASVGFTKKDLYNYFDKKMRDLIKDGDIAASLNYLNVKSSTDPMLYAKYAFSGDGRLRSLFLADGRNRYDYFCFGDVVAFDTTYKKNKYNYPLVIFSGCNQHSQTVNFGAELVSDETSDTYKWLLSCFLECMDDKYPQAVVTDGDGAMKEAIKPIFPMQPIGYVLELIKENGLEGNPWVTKTYENKSLWATAYLRDNFFGRIRTTSQCEAINAIIKSYVRKKGYIFEFMHNFDEALRHYRNNELVADFKSKFLETALTTHLRLIESDAAKIYTTDIFKEVKDEIMKAGALIVKSFVRHGDVKMYVLTKYCTENYERRVVYDGTKFQCSCKLFDSRGLPCSHIFYVMKEEHVSNIPCSMVLSRWAKDAKIEYLNMVDNGTVNSNSMEVARFGSYCSLFTSFCKEASKKNGVYGEIMEDIMKLHKKYCSADDQIGTQREAVGDPITVKSKGAPKKKKNDTKAVRHCSKCNSTTHNARNFSRNVELELVSKTDSLSQIPKAQADKAAR
ncbi:protein FAR1-RELATED SEQUENCE 5-like [Vicia villosa]|uniref:protein FAR1-RELATED SEQUENCE 5-like n=1 Tax=Vicia villosa TaxID=3911 RepID=UPI00273C1014|nr:protein FAR1-RELATED SEQUENCE 5-like [Vicia villosa]